MKKVTRISTLAILVMAMFFTIIGTAAAKEKQVTVLLNGQPFVSEDMPIMVNGSTLVPMRSIFEALDAKLTWDQKLQQVTAQKGDTQIKLVIGKKNVLVNGATKTLNAVPQLYHNRTYVPLRFVSESLGADVGWNQTTYTVTINLNQGSQTISKTTLPRLGDVPTPQESYTKEISSDWFVRYVYPTLNVTEYAEKLKQSGFELVVDKSGVDVYAKPGRLVEVVYDPNAKAYMVAGMDHDGFDGVQFFPLLVGIPAPQDKSFTSEAIVKVNGINTAQYTYDNLDLDAYIQALTFAGYTETKATNGDTASKVYTLNNAFTIYIKSVGSTTVIYAEI